MLRRVGRETEDRISGAEVLAVARSLYKMYGIEFRAREMQGVLESLESYPPEGEWIDLIAPTSA